MNIGVVVVGSVNLDVSLFVHQFPKPGETVLAQGFSTSIGGKGANQALQAVACGAEATLIGCVGRDKEAALALRTLEAAGVTAVIDKCNKPTGRAWISVDRAAENSIVVVPGANASLTPTAAVSAVGRVLAQYPEGVVVVCQGESPADVVDHVARACAERGLRFVLNLAPVIDVDIATLRTSDPLIVNDVEAHVLLERLGRHPLTGDPAAALHSLLGVPVVVTMGSRGAAVIDAHGVLTTIPAATGEAEIVDTTGAGDALVGASVAALSAGASLVDAVRTGVIAARRALSSRGASLSLITP